MAVKIIAELSGNHGGDFEKAKALVKYAADCGADGIKLQTFTPKNMAIGGYMLKDGPWAGRTLIDLYMESYTPWSWHKPLFDYANSRGMMAFSSAFCEQSVDFLVALRVPYIKIASFENNDWPLIEYAASKAKLIISTGCMSKVEFSELSWHIADNKTGFGAPLFMLCNSAYPADPKHANLMRMPNHDWGYSDHTVGSGAACAAIVLGANMIEKHITLDKTMIDGHFSDTDFARFVSDCRAAEAACDDRWGPFPGEMTDLRRSLWVVADISKGEIIKSEQIKSLRPSGGLHPKMFSDVVGKVATADLSYGDALKYEHIEW